MDSEWTHCELLTFQETCNILDRNWIEQYIYRYKYMTTNTMQDTEKLKSTGNEMSNV